MRVIREVVIGLAAVLLGCAGIGGRVEVTSSHRAKDALASPTRVFVLSRSLDADGNPNLGLEFHKALEGRLGARLARCGVATSGRIIHKTDLDQEISKAIVLFRPDAVLIVRRSHVLLYETSVARETYEVSMLEGPTGTSREPLTWWKAVVNHVPASQLIPGAPIVSAEHLADEVVSRMTFDGFFPECVAPGPNELPSALQKVTATAYAASAKRKLTGAMAVGEVVYPSARKNADADEREASVRRASGSSNDAAPPDHTSAPLSYIDAESRPMPDQLRAPSARFGRATYQPSLEVYVRTAFAAELAKMGLTADGAPRTLQLEIEDASLDLSGWGYGASLRIRYTVVETATGKAVASGTKTVTTAAHQRAASEVEAWDRVLARAAEQLAGDLEAANAL